MQRHRQLARSGKVALREERNDPDPKRGAIVCRGCDGAWGAHGQRGEKLAILTDQYVQRCIVNELHQPIYRGTATLDRLYPVVLAQGQQRVEIELDACPVGDVINNDWRVRRFSDGFKVMTNAALCWSDIRRCRDQQPGRAQG